MQPFYKCCVFVLFFSASSNNGQQTMIRLFCQWFDPANTDGSTAEPGLLPSGDCEFAELSVNVVCDQVL